MIFNVWTFLFEVVNFLVLVYVLRRLLYRPLQEAIERRRELNAKAQADALAASQQAAALKQQLDTRLAALEQERQELIKKSREEADTQRTAILAEAERAVQKRREQVAQQLEQERIDAHEALRAELFQSAVALAERFLREASTTTLQQQLANRLVQELEHIPEDERLRLREELELDGVAVVEAAAELNGEIKDLLGGALSSLLGRTLSLSVQTRPELLCGVRLRLGGHVWDATLSSGLGEAAASAARSARP